MNRQPHPRKSARSQSTTTRWMRSLLCCTVLLGSGYFGLRVLAASPKPGISITNQATGSFINTDDNSEQSTESNVVTVTVAEVAGVTVTANGVTGTTYPGATVYYSFTINNVGNDPTQFFIPSAANITSGNATQPSNIEITSYNLDGTTSVNTSVVVPTGGQQTGSNGTVAGLLGSGSAGVLLPGGSVTVRVPILINATATGTVDVQLGDTPVDSTSVTTPQARLENQAYIAGSNDVYTVDNPDSLETSTGLPINGDATNHRQEAAAVKSALVIALDYGDAPDTYKTLAASGGPSHSISSLYLGASVTADTNGQPNATATGDTGDDGVTFSPTLGANYSTLIQAGITNQATVVSSGAGFLNAWVDYNNNGIFDPGEQVLTNQPVAAGNNTVTFTIPDTALHGPTFARFRLSPNSVAAPSPTGSIIGGEVEDYQVYIAAPVPDGAACSTTGLLNGGFENPVYPINTVTTIDENIVPGWNTTSSDGKIEIWGRNFQSLGSNSGDQFAEINATQVAALFQDVATVPGATLTYQFAHRARPYSGYTVDVASVKIGAPGATVQQGVYSTDSNDWVVYRGTYVVPAGQYITRVEFNSISSGSGFGGVGNFIDDVQFSTNNCVTAISPPTIDLDGNSNTAPGNDYQNTFFTGGSPVAAADTDTVITDDRTNITRAIVKLTNPLDGANESLSFNTTLASSFGITVDQAYDSTANVPTTGRITLKGSATLAQYQQVIATLKYANTKASPTMTDRTINVQVIDSDKAISNTAVSTIKMSAGVSISGTVFEDPNYGGGAGRNLATAGTSPRQLATVELYNQATGAFVSTTTTDVAGKYAFLGVAPGDYLVRVVNSTVTSSRTGYVNTLVPVQTFRVDDSSGTPADDPNRVGGENPAVADTGTGGIGAVLDPTTFKFTTAPTVIVAGSATVGGQAESISVVKVTGDTTGIDFGYNFDTIVNTNNSGQGSLRQFVTNSNALHGEASLAQANQPAGKETSIFMIPNGVTFNQGFVSGIPSGLNGTGGNANAAVIALSTQLVITDNNTSIDARTQTTNVADSNFGTMGTGGTVGTDAIKLDTIPKPEVVLDFSPMAIVNGNFNPSGGGSNPIVIDAQNTTLAGFAYYGYRITLGLGGLNKGTIWVKPSVLDSGKATITQLFGGTMADGTKPPTNTLVGSGFQTSGAADIFNNYFAYNADGADFDNKNGSHVKFYDNELAYNGPQDNNSSNMSGIYADQMETDNGALNITVSGNLVRNSNKLSVTGAQGQGFQMSNATNMTVENNSFIDNNIFGINASTSDSLIQKNIITGTKNGPGFTQGSGIIVYYGGSPLTGLRNRISQNSIYQNFKLGIDLQIDGVTPNDGLKSPTQANGGMNYPIITSSSLSGSTLTVKGYVGKETSPGSGDSDFANVTLEFFIADDDGTQNGAVISGDGKSKPHGEGKTYIGGSTAGNLCTTDANGFFNCTFSNAGTLGLTDPKNITATATDTGGNTSEFSASPNHKSNVLLVKRITAINGNSTKNPNDNTPLNGFVDNPAHTSDNDPSWPSGVLIGAYDAGKIQPGDEIEYTIYYLNRGDNPATAKICDLLDSKLTFNPDGFVTGKGFQVKLGISAAQLLTSVDDPGIDRAQYISAPVPTLTNCNSPSTNATASGAVVFDLTSSSTTDPSNPTGLATIPGATSFVPMPNNAYGLIRFKTTVKK